jgi:probable addiction module antidote protein
MKSVFSTFDAAEFLDNDEVIAAYLTAALADDNPDVFIAALGDVAKARGMSQIAKDASLGRESLYKTLAPGAKPRFETIAKLINSLGVRIAIVPMLHAEPTTLP